MTAEEFLGIKNYLKQVLNIDIRNDLSGNRYVVLLLEDELISSVLLDSNEPDITIS